VSEPRAIIVSGGSRGLGLAIVRRCLALGDRIATFSRGSSAEFAQLAAEPHHAARLFHQQLDAADADALRAFVASAHQRFGRIDVLINNAGLGHDGVLALMAEDKIDQMLAVNLRASLLLAKECARVMLDQGAGQIISIASIIAERGSTGLAAYAATKAGQIGMTRSLARELGPRGIRVNAVAPGYLETEMSASLPEEQRQRIIRRTPLGRLGRAEDIVPVVEFLLSPAAAFITGQVLTVDGGASL